jgi:hypothetical protein
VKAPPPALSVHFRDLETACAWRRGHDNDPLSLRKSMRRQLAGVRVDVLCCVPLCCGHARAFSCRVLLTDTHTACCVPSTALRWYDMQESKLKLVHSDNKNVVAVKHTVSRSKRAELLGVDSRFHGCTVWFTGGCSSVGGLSHTACQLVVSASETWVKQARM